MTNILYAQTWVWFAYSGAGLAIMAATLVIHMRATPVMTSAPWLLVIGASLGSLGCIIGGMQAGPNPLLPKPDALAAIRVLWAIGITLGIAASILYTASNQRHK